MNHSDSSDIWPPEARPADVSPLPPPWDGDVDFNDSQTEARLLQVRGNQFDLFLRICRNTFDRAEARGDKIAALHAMYVACSSLYAASRRVPADRLFTEVRRRALGLDVSRLSIRIDFLQAKQLSEMGELARSLVLRQGVFEAALALGDKRSIVMTLGGLIGCCVEAGESELALSMCEQLEPLLDDDDLVIAAQRCHFANLKAEVWTQVSDGLEAADDHSGALSALRKAQNSARSACALARNDRESCHCTETLVKISLRLDEGDEALAQLERCVAGLDTTAAVGSEMWCLLQLAHARVEVHSGRIGAQTIENLRAIEASTGPDASDVQMVLGDVRNVLLQAQKQSGLYEQALATHQRSTRWHARRRSAFTRERLKLLRHTVMAMRAEAVEFVTHDLLTPVAAALVRVRSILEEQPPVASPTLLRAAHVRLSQSAALADRYLGLWRAELAERAQLQAVDIGSLIDDLCENFLAPAPARAVRLSRDLRIGTWVLGDRSLLVRAIAVMLSHAVEHADGGGIIRVRLQAIDEHVVGQAYLSISYRGALPPLPLQTRIHQHFADGAASDQIELGWLVVTRVLQLHRAEIAFVEESGMGDSRMEVLMGCIAEPELAGGSQED